MKQVWFRQSHCTQLLIHSSNTNKCIWSFLPLSNKSTFRLFLSFHPQIILQLSTSSFLSGFCDWVSESLFHFDSSLPVCVIHFSSSPLYCRKDVDKIESLCSLSSWGWLSNFALRRLRPLGNRNNALVTIGVTVNIVAQRVIMSSFTECFSFKKMSETLSKAGLFWLHCMAAT